VLHTVGGCGFGIGMSWSSAWIGWGVSPGQMAIDDSDEMRQPRVEHALDDGQDVGVHRDALEVGAVHQKVVDAHRLAPSKALRAGTIPSARSRRSSSLVIVPCFVGGPLGGPLGASRAQAQVCQGDCGADGAVSIGDLIVAINISLGRAALTACESIDANRNGVVAINELVAAVGNGLRGCPATPTPSATAPPTLTPLPSATPTVTLSPSPTSTPTVTATASVTATPTTTPTATPTASSTPTVHYPDVSGQWDEGQLGLVSSTCLEIFATEFAAELARRPPCPHQVSSAGPIATVVDCSQRAFVGQVDPQGVVSYVRPDEIGEEGGCTITLASSVRVQANLSPTVAVYFFEIRFSGACPLDSCELTAAAPWTRLSPF
jgi:hypothetical protein